MRTIALLIATLVAVLAASPAPAHEGHGDPRWVPTVAHYLVEPEHAWAVWIIVGVVVWDLACTRRRAKR